MSVPTEYEYVFEEVFCTSQNTSRMLNRRAEQGWEPILMSVEGNRKSFTFRRLKPVTDELARRRAVAARSNSCTWPDCDPCCLNLNTALGL